MNNRIHANTMLTLGPALRAPIMTVDYTAALKGLRLQVGTLTMGSKLLADELQAVCGQG
jgi:hypothetical protein